VDFEAFGAIQKSSRPRGESNVVFLYTGFLRIYGATFIALFPALFLFILSEETYLVGGLDNVLVGVAGVVAVLVGCFVENSLSAVLSFPCLLLGPLLNAAQTTREDWGCWVELTVGESSGERVDAVEDDGACDGRSINIQLFLGMAHAYVVFTNRQCRREPWGGL